ASGETPATADLEADDMIARLVGSLDAGEDQNRSFLPANNNWLDRLRVSAGDLFLEARPAVRFVPDSEAFFKGDDPLLIVASLPQLLTVDLALTNQSVSLETLNTFDCNLEILALTKASVAEVRTVFRSFTERTEIHQITPLPHPAEASDDLARATSILEP